MSESRTPRRTFILAAGGLTIAVGHRARACGDVEAPLATAGSPVQDAAQQAPAVPELTTASVAEAEKFAGVAFTDAERRMIVASDPLEDVRRAERLRAVELPNALAPAGVHAPIAAPDEMPAEDLVRIVARDPGPLPADDEAIAFAPITALGHWLRAGSLSARRLTEIAIDRLQRFDPVLKCVVTLTTDLARRQAADADRARARGEDLGPLHGIPWGAKDLFDTRDIPTTWGAEPYRQRVPERNAVVVDRLEAAGAVLVAKLTLGALAYGDIWFGGRTNNPFDPSQGSSGSSAGSAAATAAGCVAFALGTETYGSIVSPSMRCGTTGLRPTFGRVARTGAMALCWSLDKIGPITRTVEDAVIVLDAIRGADAGDPSSVSRPLTYDGAKDLRELAVGWNPAWFERASDIDRATLDAIRNLGVRLVTVDLPDWPYDALLAILHAEAAAAFDELTRSNRDDELSWQAPVAWPNTFRRARLAPAVELVQAQRFRRLVMEMMHERLAGVDALAAPSFAANLLLITNNTGHPSLTIRAGITPEGRPHGFTIVGRPWREGDLCVIGRALEESLGVWDARPSLG